LANTSNKSTPLLVLGCQRSGTTLLAAMLGRHSEINMLFESTTKDVLKLMGKTYSGNKLLAWRQIRMNQRASKFGHLQNRIANVDFFKAGTKHHHARPHPTSSLSINDYINLGAKLITIVRDKDEVINSITSRTTMSETQAEKEYRLAMKMITELEHKAYQLDFYNLVHHPKHTLSNLCTFLNLQFEERMLKGAEYNIVYPQAEIKVNKAKRLTDSKK